MHQPFVNKTVEVIFKSQSFGLSNISAPQVNFLGCYGRWVGAYSSVTPVGGWTIHPVRQGMEWGMGLAQLFAGPSPGPRECHPAVSPDPAPTGGPGPTAQSQPLTGQAADRRDSPHPLLLPTLPQYRSHPLEGPCGCRGILLYFL